MKIDDSVLISLYLSGKSQTEISKTLGLTKAQISRRFHKSSFQDTLREYRAKLIDSVCTEISLYSRKAVKTIGELMNSESEYVRLSASKTIINLTLDFSLQNDILCAIEELKAQNSN